MYSRRKRFFFFFYYFISRILIYKIRIGIWSSLLSVGSWNPEEPDKVIIATEIRVNTVSTGTQLWSDSQASRRTKCCELDSYSTTHLCWVLDSVSPTHSRLSLVKYYYCFKNLLFYFIIIIGYDDMIERVHVIYNYQIS